MRNIIQISAELRSAKISSTSPVSKVSSRYKTDLSLLNVSTFMLGCKLFILNCSAMSCNPDEAEQQQLEEFITNQTKDELSEIEGSHTILQSEDEIFPAATPEDLTYYEEAISQFCSPISKIHGFLHRKIIDTALVILAKSLYPQPPRIQKYTNFYIGQKLDIVIKDNLKAAHTIQRKDGEVHLWEYLETNTKPFWPLSLLQQPYRLHVVFAISTNKDGIVTQEILTVEHGIFENLRLPVRTQALFRFWS